MSVWLDVRSVQNIILYLLFLNLLMINLAPCMKILAKSEKIPKKQRSKEFDWKRVPWGYSSVELSRLYLQETNVHMLMTKYEIVLSHRLEVIKRYLKDYEESVPTSNGPFWNRPKTKQEMGNIIASHPLMTFRMLRRFAEEVKSIKDSLSYESDLKELLDKAREEIEWPTKLDVDLSIDRIIKMQFTYDFPTSEVSSGIFYQQNFTQGLSRIQTLDIGQRAVEKGYYALGIEWLDIGSKKEIKSLTDQLVNGTELEIITKNAISQHDEEYDSTDSGIKLFETKLSEFQGSENIFPHKQRTLYKGIDEDKFFADINIVHRYNILCSTDLDPFLQRPLLRNRLKCWMDLYSNPYFRIQPLKMEMFSFEPYLVQIHELITPSFSKKLQLMSIGLQKLKNEHNSGESSIYSFANLNEKNMGFKTFRNFEKLLEKITDLKVLGEPLEISEHKTGSKYSIKSPDQDINKTTGDNVIVNFMIHLSSSPIGAGRLVFPILGISVPPIPGSAVIWYESSSSGHPDKRTMHAHCPTIFGSKWIAMKRIKLKNNIVNFKCSRQTMHRQLYFNKPSDLDDFY